MGEPAPLPVRKRTRGPLGERAGVHTEGQHTRREKRTLWPVPVHEERQTLVPALLLFLSGGERQATGNRLNSKRLRVQMEEVRACRTAASCVFLL